MKNDNFAEFLNKKEIDRKIIFSVFHNKKGNQPKNYHFGS